ncbi:Uncharacterised protein [Mycobacteroides abscessus subsp. abscessus]|nr:Uncharacterised protein [Mycobacteroides abscessus subsp. abscessus]
MTTVLLILRVAATVVVTMALSASAARVERYSCQNLRDTLTKIISPRVIMPS